MFDNFFLKKMKPFMR